jgi:hypothetical protein
MQSSFLIKRQHVCAHVDDAESHTQIQYASNKKTNVKAELTK